MGPHDRTRKREINTAWRALPGRTRRELVLAAVKGRRPRTDAATWRTALDWTELYPAQAVPQVLMGACFLWLSVAGLYDRFTWLMGVWSVFLLLYAAGTTFVAYRVRRNPGPEQPAHPEQLSDHPVDRIRS